jgi:acyl-CoA thioester hydrolase
MGSAEVSIAPFRFSHRLRVRWAEVDPQGIVFNAHYLTYFDVTVTEYWRAVGRPYPREFVERGFDTFAVKATLEYHSPARFDEELDVRCRMARLGTTSMRLAFEVHRDSDHLVSGELIYVTASTDTRRPVTVPDFLRDAVIKYEATAPEQG